MAPKSTSNVRKGVDDMVHDKASSKVARRDSKRRTKPRRRFSVPNHFRPLHQKSTRRERRRSERRQSGTISGPSTPKATKSQVKPRPTSLPAETSKSLQSSSRKHEKAHDSAKKPESKHMSAPPSLPLPQPQLNDMYGYMHQRRSNNRPSPREMIAKAQAAKQAAEASASGQTQLQPPPPPPRPHHVELRYQNLQQHLRNIEKAEADAKQRSLAEQRAKKRPLPWEKQEIDYFNFKSYYHLPVPEHLKKQIPQEQLPPAQLGDAAREEWTRGMKEHGHGQKGKGKEKEMLTVAGDEDREFVLNRSFQNSQIMANRTAKRMAKVAAEIKMIEAIAKAKMLKKIEKATKTQEFKEWKEASKMQKIQATYADVAARAHAEASASASATAQVPAQAPAPVENEVAEVNMALEAAAAAREKRGPEGRRRRVRRNDSKYDRRTVTQIGDEQATQEEVQPATKTVDAEQSQRNRSYIETYRHNGSSSNAGGVCGCGSAYDAEFEYLRSIYPGPTPEQEQSKPKKKGLCG
ncbi:uncharacterized protein F4822DRAFT_202137 [Hypoxylon trugodes]|uniref:uncharacterized protein n=1 Tax=Hypoxylon trugodes TaxID=326681 RepID=UPI002198293C|nr:uncharacterized protein F4822DRAFT_202137 [Hypoxylon trugodes]KAI1389475.1 hypothetical protein F4822DRAFT_202137 [Hypoxylon trugodes]